MGLVGDIDIGGADAAYQRGAVWHIVNNKQEQDMMIKEIQYIHIFNIFI